MSTSPNNDASNHTADQLANSNKLLTGDCIKPFNRIPGPWPSLPLIGTLWQHYIYTLTGRYDVMKLHEIYIEKYHHYGPIFKEEFQWRIPIVHIFDPADFETVFRSQGRCPVRPPNDFVSCYRNSCPERYPNVGIANMNGEEWYHLRNKLTPATMRMKTINENMLTQNEICDDFLDYLWNIRDPDTNVVNNIQEAAYRLALESICMFCMDTRIGAFINDSQAICPNDGDILIETTKLLFDTYNKLYYGFSFWKYFNTPTYNDLKLAETRIYDVASKYVEKAFDEVSMPTERQTILQTLINSKQLSKEEIKTVIIDFITGGIFTVSNTFAYLFYHLAVNQDVQAKLYDEIVQVKNLEPNESGLILPSHIARMPYLKACVQECLRLNCPVPGIMRVTSKSLILSGYNIPANTTVFSHFMATCRLEEYFKEADKFRPERWIDPIEKTTIHPFSLLPFGWGTRMCMGKRFSETEIYLTMVKFIEKYRIELAVEHQELELKHAFIVIPAHPISLKLILR